jgi:hypothetical protein
MKAFQIIINVNESGVLQTERPAGMAPITILGFLEFAKATVIEEMIRPTAPQNVIPASNGDLKKLIG